MDTVIVGLGNPGAEYKNTRHNMGFYLLDSFASSYRAEWNLNKKFRAETSTVQIRGKKVLLAKPQTFMNESGKSLRKIADFYKLSNENFIVVYDDITLEKAALKVSIKGGNAGHNGIESILQNLGNGFTRYRIGVGGKAHPEMDLKDHVLGKISTEEKTLIENQLKKLEDGLAMIVDKGASLAMNHLNSKNK